MHDNLIKLIILQIVNIHMCKQILLDLEHGFIHKAKEARHIRISVTKKSYEFHW